MPALSSLNLENTSLVTIYPALGSLELHERRCSSKANPCSSSCALCRRGGTLLLLSLWRDGMSEPPIRGSGVTEGRDVDEGRKGNRRREDVSSLFLPDPSEGSGRTSDFTVRLREIGTP